MQKLRGVILDVDGTLIDSNDAHTRAWVQALHEAGFEVPFERVRWLIGKGGDKLLPEVSGLQKDDPKGKQISERRGEIFKADELPKLQGTPGARELLAELRRRGLKLVVASSAKEDELKELLKVIDADDLIEETTSSDDAKHSKPDPDIVAVALERIGLSADEVVMLGDTPYDIEAARKCGVGTIALRSGGWQDKDLSEAIAIYDDPQDVLEEYGDQF